jgi:ABC-type phosphate transport system substrate-binding protein
MSTIFKSGKIFSSASTVAVAATLIVGSLVTGAQAVPSIGGVPGQTPPGNSYADCVVPPTSIPAAERICSNGVGATFPFPFFAGGVPDSTPAGLFFSTFPGLFNYAARGSGTGISQFILQIPPAQNLPGSPTVPGPLTFASTDAPLTQNQLNQYFAAQVDNGNGFGPIVELPSIAGSVVVLYNDTDSATSPNAASSITLTRAQECNIFNGTPQTVTRPQGGTVTLSQGVRRSDGSGTTFIQTNHLNSVCSNGGAIGTGGNGTGANLWTYTATTPVAGFPSTRTVSRGFGQVSLSQSSAACQAATAALPNTVCWPSAFLTASGNPGVAAAVNTGADGTFGYVELGTAAVLNAVTGNAAPVDTDLLTSNNPSARTFINTDIARLTNRAGVVVDGTAQNINDALLTATDRSPAQCRVVYEEPDPTQGYPVIGVNYFLFYGDYTPDDETPIEGRGAALAQRYIDLVSNSVGNAALADQFGYSTLPPARQDDVVFAALDCIQAVPFNGPDGGLNVLDNAAPGTVRVPAGQPGATVGRNAP